MSENDDRTFVADGKTYELVDVETLTFGENRKLKRLSGGMPMVRFGAALEEGDPDALYALLTVSAQRQNPKLSDDFLDDCNFADVMETLVGDDDDEADGERPTELPESDERTSGS